MNPKIYIFNPNSLEAVTAAIDRAVVGYRRLPVDIACLTSTKGPAGIQTQTEADAAVAPLCDMARPLAGDASAIVIACFSDPGLHALREQVGVPVFGIGECGMLTAMTLGQRIGVIAISATSVPRHLRYFASMGLMARVVRERSIDLSVAESTDRSRTLSRMIDTGLQLGQDGADVLVMGCAGMADLREAVQDGVGLPVVEPTQAAVGMAVGRVFGRMPR